MYITEVQAAVHTWLQGEHEYQFEKNQRTHEGDPSRSLWYITRVEIPQKWHRFQLFHQRWWEASGADALKLQAQASQQLLKVAAASRGVFVWGRVIEGATRDEASDESWDVLSSYEQAVLDGEKQMPPESDLFSEKVPIEMPLTVLSPDLAERFTYFGGLAVVQLLEAETRSGMYMMPRPGVSSGN